MRIIQILLTRRFGGTERYFVDVVKGLASKGHPVLAIIHPSAATVLRSLIGVPGVTLVFFRLRRLRMFLSFLPLMKEVKGFSPDLVEFHQPAPFLIVFLLKELLSLPVVLRFHLNYENIRSGTFTRFSFLTDHQKQRDTYSGFDQEKCDVFPNFSNFPLLRKSEILCRQDVTIFSYGRFVYEKGFDILLQTLSELVSSRPLRLVLAGTGELKDDLYKLCENLKITEHVEFVGWVDNVTPYLMDCDLCVIPSRVEPFGLVILEAMASGVPIVSTKTTGAMSILDENTASLCEPGNVRSLKDAIVNSLPDSQGKLLAINERRRAAQEKFEKEFQFDSVYPQILEHYRRAIDARSI